MPTRPGDGDDEVARTRRGAGLMLSIACSLAVSIRMATDHDKRLPNEVNEYRKPGLLAPAPRAAERSRARARGRRA